MHCAVINVTCKGNQLAGVIKYGSQSWANLYNKKQWFKLRHHQLRNHPLCVYCAKLGKVTEAKIVDHIKPHKGDEALFFDADNLQSLCKPCHDSVKKQLEMSGKLRGSGMDGTPLDANHHWNRIVLP